MATADDNVPVEKVASKLIFILHVESTAVYRYSEMY